LSPLEEFFGSDGAGALGMPIAFVSPISARPLIGSSAPSLGRRPAHDRNGADAVFPAALDDAIAISNINQNVTLPVEKASHMEGFEGEAASFIKDALDVFVSNSPSVYSSEKNLILLRQLV
jgi:hypothetical protein